MTVLDEILARKRADLEVWRVRPPGPPAPGPAFLPSARGGALWVIAEVKRRSPSAGAIRTPFDPSEIARAYERGGAHAVSVLMDEPFFGGGADDFRAVRAAVGLPMLYKEFVLDPWQVAHAAALGASAVLLIVAALPPDELAALMAEIRRLGMTPLVEVHTAAELDIAVASGAECIGINNRDLHTFRTTLETTLTLRPRIPPDRWVVSESGIRTADDLRRLRDAGVDAALVGESLLRQSDPEAALRALCAQE
jgi:indole-3-glycerol phosphate synthase